MHVLFKNFTGHFIYIYGLCWTHEFLKTNKHLLLSVKLYLSHFIYSQNHLGKLGLYNVDSTEAKSVMKSIKLMFTCFCQITNFYISTHMLHIINSIEIARFNYYKVFVNTLKHFQFSR